MNVLVIAPHPDDEAIGCGGSILRHRSHGDDVEVVFLTSGELGLKHLPAEEAWRVRESEAHAAAEILGIGRLSFLRQPDWYLEEHVEAAGERLAEILEATTPEVLYLPHPDEWHPDHRASLPIVEAATARAGHRANLIYLYEVWTPLTTYDHVLDISDLMEQKVAAVRAYPSQLRGFRYDDAILGLDQYRGALAGRCRYAEVFRGGTWDVGRGTWDVVRGT